MPAGGGHRSTWAARLPTSAARRARSSRRSTPRPGSPPPWNPGANEAVTALALVNDTLYVGGRFTQLAGTARNHAGAVHATTGVAAGVGSECGRHGAGVLGHRQHDLPGRRVPERRRQRAAARRVGGPGDRRPAAVASGYERSGARRSPRRPRASPSAGRSRPSAVTCAATSPPSTSRPDACCRGGRGPTASCWRWPWRAIAGSTWAARSRPSPASRATAWPRSTCPRTTLSSWNPGADAPVRALAAFTDPGWRHHDLRRRRLRGGRRPGAQSPGGDRRRQRSGAARLRARRHQRRGARARRQRRARLCGRPVHDARRRGACPIWAASIASPAWPTPRGCRRPTASCAR